MPKKQQILRKLKGFSLAISTTVVLAACGGGSDNTPAFASRLASTFNVMVGQLSTAAGLAGAATLESFDAAYLDAGYSRAMLATDLAANANALTSDPDLSLFPAGTLSNAVIEGCDAKNVCTLRATLTNSDADVTSVDFSTKVVFSNGAYRFLGDQANS